MRLALTSRTFRGSALHAYSSEQLIVSFDENGEVLSRFLSSFSGSNKFQDETLRFPRYIKSMHIKNYTGHGPFLIQEIMTVFPDLTTFILSNCSLSDPDASNSNIPSHPHKSVDSNLTIRLKGAREKLKFLIKPSASDPTPESKAPPKLTVEHLEFNNHNEYYVYWDQLLSTFECFDKVNTLAIHGNLWAHPQLSPEQVDKLSKISELELSRITVYSHPHPILQVLPQTSIPTTLISLSVSPDTIADCMILGELVPKCTKLQTLKLAVSVDIIALFESEGKNMSIFNLLSCSPLNRLNLSIGFYSEKTRKAATNELKELIGRSLKDLLSGLPAQVKILDVEVRTEGTDTTTIPPTAYSESLLCENLGNGIRKHVGLEKIIIQCKHRELVNPNTIIEGNQSQSRAGRRMKFEDGMRRYILSHEGLVELPSNVKPESLEVTSELH
ncbi:hypothetical protein C8Q75DRAFT_784654 [Abortiporus biennis]|nr:hypothetical protein C8Q75DRAFT_784654 [Abortiporus biennis]